VYASDKGSTGGQVTLPEPIRTRLNVQAGDLLRFRVTGPDTFEVRVLPQLPLAEMLRRFPIEGPIDEPAAREHWEAAAAEEVIRKALGSDDDRAAARQSSPPTRLPQE
jgi:bifunctional DNA-binding transcriptional regulator/antitoxin component of YhaV-PrlF toxin-antitoxin module